MKRTSISLAILTAIYGHTAFAESMGESGSVMNTVTVTATRVEQINTDVAANIGVKDQDEIELDAPILQRELFSSIAGVRVTQTGSTIGHKTSIRMPENTAAYYLFLQDGIPVQSPGFFNHNGLAYTNYSSSGTTEVLKGTGTALYGSDSVAGTINVLSKDVPEKEVYSVKVEAGSDGFKRLTASGGSQIQPDTGVAVDASHADSDGWRDHTAHTRDELTFKHVYDVDDRNELNTTFSFNKSVAEMAGSLIGLAQLNSNPTYVGDVESSLSLVDMKRKFDFLRLGTEWRHDYSDDTQISTIGYLRNTRNRYTTTWENNLPQNDSKEKSLGIMLKADIDKGDFRYITGLDVEYTQASKEYVQLFNYTPSGWGSSVAAGSIYDYDVDFYSIAPYARVEHDITRKLQLAGGLRYDASGFDYTNNLADGQYSASSSSRAAENNDPDFRHLSPKLDLSYKLDENELIYVRYANGFRIPSASRLYSLTTDNIAFTLDPEKTDSYEVGYKIATAQHEIGGSIYHMTIKDTIVRRENGNGDRYYVNGDSSVHKGVELSLLSRISEQFKSKLAYSYSKHHYKNDTSYGDNEQAAAPNHTMNLRLTYTPKQLNKLTAMLEWEHVGEYWMDDSHTVSYEGYDVGHLKLSYKPDGDLSLFAKINNLTDKIYAESASYSYGKEKYTPAAPRQLFVGLEYKFK